MFFSIIKQLSYTIGVYLYIVAPYSRLGSGLWWIWPHVQQQQPDTCDIFSIRTACRERRLGSLVIRQDRFLYIATATLLHLAEDTTVQRKMRKRDIVGLLAAMLSRPHVELLLLAAGFLRRLCVYQVIFLTLMQSKCLGSLLLGHILFQMRSQPVRPVHLFDAESIIMSRQIYVAATAVPLSVSRLKVCLILTVYSAESCIM